MTRRGRSADEIIAAHQAGTYRPETRAEYDARAAESERLRWEHGSGTAERHANGRVDATIRRQQHEAAYRAYLEHGAGDDLRHQYRLILDRYQDEHRDMAVASGSAGGYLVSPSVFSFLSIGLRVGAPMLAACNLISTPSGSSLPYPTVDDTGNVGAILAENTAASVQDVTFGSRSLSSFVYTSRPLRMSVQLDTDAAPT